MPINQLILSLYYEIKKKLKLIICCLQPGIEYNIYEADVFSLLLCEMIYFVVFIQIRVNLLKRSSLCLFLVAVFHI